jgi:hypothetical protein
LSPTAASSLPVSKNESDFAEYLAGLWEPLTGVVHHVHNDAGRRPNSYSSSSFCHEYAITRHRAWRHWRTSQVAGTASQVTAYEGRRRALWWCGSLKEAALHYSWTVSLVGSFTTLATALQLAIKTGNHTASKTVCLKIFQWGGVGRKPTDPSRVWLEGIAGAHNLVQRLRVARRVLHPLRIIRLSMFHRVGLLMNAAMTKVYAASDPQNIIIYDGRVGAALCLLVREFLSAKCYSEVPADLAFLWGPPQKGPTGMRNPSTEQYIFKSLNQYGVNDQQRAETARRANRVLSAMLANLKATGVVVPLPEVEKSLFMIGYDVRG